MQPLYGVRALDTRTFPYVSGELRDGELVSGAIEYPVLTGMAMWVAALVVEDPNAYLVVNALLLAPFGLLVAHLLARMGGRRALMWAAAPALVLYAFHNWDLYAVAAAVGGIWLWARGRHGVAAVAFGLGAAFKLYPILFVVPLVLDLLWARRRRDAGRAAGAAAGAWVAVNVPFAALHPAGWWATYAFHRERPPNLDSIWYLGLPTPFDDPSAVNLVSGALIALSSAAVVVAAWRMGERRESFPAIQTCGALVAVFMLWNKVHSPQYTLWLLPFFALVRIRPRWWVAYSVADLMVYVGVFRWFYDWVYRAVDIDQMTGAKLVLIAGIWARAALLAALVVAFLRAESVAGVTPGDDPPPGRSFPSQPVPSVSG